MLVNTREIEKKIMRALENDPELSACVSKFTVGSMDMSRARFPFVNLSCLRYRENMLRAASGSLLYMVDIYVGTQSLAPEVAYMGKEGGGKKAAVEICRLVREVVENNAFDGAFIHVVGGIRCNPCYRTNKAETIIIGAVSFTGETWFKH